MAKKNNTAEKALLNAEKISKALREGTEKTLKSIVNEAISDFIKDEDEPESEELEKEEQPIDDDSFEVEDVETEETPEDDAETETPSEEGEGEGAPEEEGGADDEWADMEDFKVGDNDYDFTSVDGETALKVYNKLGDDDQIFIKKEDDGTYTMQDEDTGAEYVIELGNDGDADADADNASEEEPAVEEPEEEDEPTFEIELGDDEEPTDGEDEDEEKLNEDLGYTDSYQKKNPIDGLNMNEPADGKTTNDWDEGAPKGTEKPWAGKGDSDPFEKTVNEEEVVDAPVDAEANLEEDGGAARTSVKDTHVVKGDKEKEHRQGFPKRGPGANKTMNESTIKKIISKAKEIQAENKQYKETIAGIKKALYEAAILNINYGKVVSLLVNETTTKEEKANIVERFNNVKTVNEGTILYDTIKRELNESRKATPIVERTINAESSKKINETTIYSPKDNASIQLMERMDNLYKRNKK